MQEKQLERVVAAKEKAKLRSGTLTIASELDGKTGSFIPYISVKKVSDGVYFNPDIIKRIEAINRLKDSTFYERLDLAKKTKSERLANKSITRRNLRRRK